MTHPVDMLALEASAAIEAMKAAALHARHLHARAELARHMRTTAHKMREFPIEEATSKVSAEWMNAWALDATAYPELASQITRFTAAFCLDARGSTPGTRAAIIAALEVLETRFAENGTTLSDQMAFRSECAHGWWNGVVPIPPLLRDEARLALQPKPGTDQPFWTAGARPHCVEARTPG